MRDRIATLVAVLAQSLATGPVFARSADGGATPGALSAQHRDVAVVSATTVSDARVSSRNGASRCAQRPEAAPRLGALRDALVAGRFVAYSPTGLQIHDGRVTPANDASIRADLTVLRPRFDSLVTYGALNGHELVPSIARSLGFRTLVIGIWDVRDARELDAALDAARRHPRLVAGVVLGNELLLSGRGTSDDVRAAIATVRRRAPDLPIATSEPFHLHYDGAGRALLADLDFLAPNVHPMFQPWWRDAPDANGAAFVAGVVRELRARFCGPLLVKETGVPTAPPEAGFTPARQASFYAALRTAMPPSRDAAFAYFAAFDAPWRVADEQAVAGHHPEEAHWGLYDAQRRAKPAIAAVPPLQYGARPR
jgi:exo-beta-1,3-glucanase (GH17 family)